MIPRLQKIYRTLNKELFDGRLSTIPFVVNQRQRKLTISFLRPSTLEIGCKVVAASPTEVLDDLVHAMVHIHNQARGVVDFSPTNRYHKAEFCQEALRVGLYVSHHSVHGWSIVHSQPQDVTGFEVRRPIPEDNDKLREIYRRLDLPAVVFSQFQVTMKGDLSKTPRKYSYRYTCECHPPQIIRSGRQPEGSRPLEATCPRCGANFVLHGLLAIVAFLA